jgi:polysaccharide pyruvyl transferase WcaK-like protein
MRKLAVLGWYGHGNFGDELILEGLRQLFHDWQITVYANDFTSAYPFMDFKEVNKCDLFVLGGGELINPNNLFLPSRSLYRFKYRSVPFRLYSHTPFAFPPWVHRIKIPKIILGCGVNGNNVEAKVVRELEQFSFIGLRDNVAVQILKAKPTLTDKVNLFHDLVFAINMTRDTCRFLARVFPFKLHGLILSHMAGIPYTFPFYHPKVQRVHDTIKELELDKIQETQRASINEISLLTKEWIKL